MVTHLVITSSKFGHCLKYTIMTELLYALLLDDNSIQLHRYLCLQILPCLNVLQDKQWNWTMVKRNLCIFTPLLILIIVLMDVLAAEGIASSKEGFPQILRFHYLIIHPTLQ